MHLLAATVMLRLLLALVCFGSVSSYASIPPQGRLVASFSYNADGQRIEKRGERGIERYTYDDQSVLSQRDGSNALVARYTYGPNRLISLEHKTEGTQFYLTDALNSIVDLMTTDGLVQARYQYDAFGNKRSESGSSWNRFAFTGYEEDKETNLLYAKARYYDADTGRFLSQDAWQGDNNSPPSLHKYLYAYQNPTVWIDPTGNTPCFGDNGKCNNQSAEDVEKVQKTLDKSNLKLTTENTSNGNKGGLPEGATELLASAAKDGNGATLTRDGNGVTITKENEEKPSGTPPTSDDDGVLADAQLQQQRLNAKLLQMGAGADLLVSFNTGKAIYDAADIISHLTPEQVYNTYVAAKAMASDNPNAAAAMATLVVYCKGRCGDDIGRAVVKDEIKFAKAEDDLAAFRKGLGLPAAGSAADKSTLAMMEVNGKKMYGINAHGQPVSGVNSISKTHAEIDVLNQIKQQGINVQGQSLTLHVDRDPCLACGQNGGIKSMVSQLGIKELTVIGPSGPTVIRP